MLILQTTRGEGGGGLVFFYYPTIIFSSLPPPPLNVFLFLDADPYIWEVINFCHLLHMYVCSPMSDLISTLINTCIDFIINIMTIKKSNYSSMHYNNYFSLGFNCYFRVRDEIRMTIAAYQTLYESR